MNSRSAAIIFDGSRIFFVHRINGKQEHYVMPDGSMESVFRFINKVSERMTTK